MYICITCTYRFATALTFCLSSQNYSSAAVAGTCNVVKSNLLKSSQESQKLVTGVRLESTINAVIEGIHVHRSVKLFLVLLRGLRGAPQSLSTARTPHARPSLCPRKIPAGTRGAPYPPRSLLAGPRSVLAGVWNYLQPVVYMYVCTYFVWPLCANFGLPVSRPWK